MLGTATGLEIVECLGSTEMLNVYLSNIAGAVLAL